MVLFFVGIGILLLGYFLYSRFIARVYEPNISSKTPAIAYADGVDYVPLHPVRNALIQFLNIAGTGPIFGPILGALFGPIAFIIIPLGCVFGGAVHDYSIGMISLRNKGAHVPQLAGYFLGPMMKHVVNIFIMLLLILLGTVFVRSPADLLTVTFHGNVILYGTIIFLYYIIATIVPIDTIISRLYPYLGAVLGLSAISIIVGIFVMGYEFPPITWDNVHPDKLPIIPMFFMIVTCGLISGFHATQSPIIARTLQNETQGRIVFYGMMIAEGVVAMIWAAAAMVLYHKTGIYTIATFGGPAGVVSSISTDIFGVIVGAGIMLGVIILPITSGDTSFRSLRMIIADYMSIPQQKTINRLLISIPLFIISFILFFIDFNVLWRYFSWANQTTGVIALAIATAYLFIKRKNYVITAIPFIFMLFVTLAYLGNAKIGFNLSWNSSYIFATITSIIILLFFFTHIFILRKKQIITENIFE